MDNSHDNTGNIWLSVFALLGVALIFIVMLYFTIFSFNPPVIDKKAEPFSGATQSGQAESQLALKESTGILGQVVYDKNQHVIGVLYDAYINPQDGKILWMSVNVDGMPHADLVLLPVDETNFMDLSMKDAAVLNLRMDRNAFMERPRQKQHEEALVGLISLRDLPGSSIADFQKNIIGEIIKITYSNGAPDLVYFSVRGQPAPSTGTPQVFALPFEYVIFSDIGSMEGKTNALLTERQAGAIEAYLKSAQPQ